MAFKSGTTHQRGRVIGLFATYTDGGGQTRDAALVRLESGESVWLPAESIAMGDLFDVEVTVSATRREAPEQA